MFSSMCGAVPRQDKHPLHTGVVYSWGNTEGINNTVSALIPISQSLFLIPGSLASSSLGSVPLAPQNGGCLLIQRQAAMLLQLPEGVPSPPRAPPGAGSAVAPASQERCCCCAGEEGRPSPSPLCPALPSHHWLVHQHQLLHLYSTPGTFPHHYSKLY